MAIVVVGGQSRNLGKTSVVAGIIAALPACNWTAFKLTQFGHGKCSLDGKPCDCATEDHCWAISEEKDRSGGSDSARFLAAGAKRSFWVRTEQGRLVEAMPAIQRRLGEAENAILESNSVLKFIKPDLYITVLDPGTEDFKVSARKFLDRADAIVLHETAGGTPAWLTQNQRGRLPVFRISPPRYVTPELVQLVKQKLESLKPTPTSLP